LNLSFAAFTQASWVCPEKTALMHSSCLQLGAQFTLSAPQASQQIGDSSFALIHERWLFSPAH
jgi:hypothetical protein